MVDTTTGTTAAATSILREDLHALREDLDLIFNSGQLRSGLAALTNVYFLHFLENMFLSGWFISLTGSVQPRFLLRDVADLTCCVLTAKIRSCVNMNNTAVTLIQ